MGKQNEKRTIMQKQEDSVFKKLLTPSRIIPLSFLAVILAGTLLLMIPAATAEGEHTSFLTALFTSTTSVCVTGLVVVDTFRHWTLFGKAVILVLIQIGGLGVISVISIFPLLTGRRFSLRERILVHDALGVDSFRGLMKYLRSVSIGTFAVEGAGALVYAIAFVPRFGLARGIWYGIFHSISAFCNAGIDILGPDSLIPWNSQPLVLINTMVLIVLGGLGYVVWFNIARSCRRPAHRVWGEIAKVRCGRRGNETAAESAAGRARSGRSAAGRDFGTDSSGRAAGAAQGTGTNGSGFSIWQLDQRSLSEHTKLVLILTAVLIFGGAVLVYLAESGNPDTLGGMPFGQRVLNSIFQSVTFRTAGFASVPQNRLTDTSVLLGCMLMFIGGSPTGTAGGVKTVTMFLVLLSILSYVRGQRQALVFRRSVTAEMREKAATIVAYNALVTFVLLVLLLVLSPSVSLTDGLYEMCSATATVGLSRGITSTLTAGGRIVVILAMFMGRTAPISMAVFFLSGRGEKNGIRYATGRFIVG